MSTEKDGFFKAKRIIVEAIDARLEKLYSPYEDVPMFTLVKEGHIQALNELRNFIRNGVLYESSVRGGSTESEE